MILCIYIYLMVDLHFVEKCNDVWTPSPSLATHKALKCDMVVLKALLGTLSVSIICGSIILLVTIGAVMGSLLNGIQISFEDTLGKALFFRTMVCSVLVEQWMSQSPLFPI